MFEAREFGGEKKGDFQGCRIYQKLLTENRKYCILATDK